LILLRLLFYKLADVVESENFLIPKSRKTFTTAMPSSSFLVWQISSIIAVDDPHLQPIKPLQPIEPPFQPIEPAIPHFPPFLSPLRTVVFPLQQPLDKRNSKLY
jgi:hypothetical protein